ncbi:M16 family metallopeptidase [Flavicella sediminum]|uniref:M16 family metallopeptidase n=1 Tax=Flavicella sediminum TaxID=2585141 RepID=UPI00111FEFE3|nr:insulinase family protein [Flavicella sediminum]
MKNILYLLSAVLLAFLIPNQVSAQEIGGIPMDASVKKGVLSNGLTYYIRKNSKPEQKVELRLVVKAGSILETEKQLGLAHFMEHMNFNGSKNFNKNELVDYLQSIGVKFGAHLNAYTSFDETVYILPIPTDNDEKLEKGFQILEDWAFNASLTEEEIDKERGVVLEEYRLGLGAGKRMMKNYLPKLMHNSHYAERLPIGTKEVLENFTYNDLRSFYRDWYRPDLMAVIAVGDVDVAVLEQKIKDHFESYPAAKNPKERVEYTVPNHKETFVAIESDKEAPNSTVQLYYKDLDDKKPVQNLKAYRKGIVNSLFVKMINKRLNELRNAEKPPFVFGYSTHGGTWAKSKAAYQSAAMTSEEGQLKALETLVLENERVFRHGFHEGELERVKDEMLNAMERAFKEQDKTESSRFASEYIRNFLKEEVIPGVTWEYEMLKKLIPTIRIEDCNALISGYIHDDNRVVIFTGPEKEGTVKVKEADVLKVLSEVKNKEVLPYEDKEVAKSLLKEIPKKGSIVSKERDELLDVTNLVLSNGAKVTYKKTDFKNDKIIFSAYSYGGTSLYTDEEVHKTDIANNALTQAGVNGFSITDMSKVLSGKMVSVNPTIGALSEGFHGSSTPKDVELLFQLTHLYFTKLNHDVKAYNSFKAKMTAYLKNVLAEPSTYFSVKLNDFLNANDPRYVGFPDEKVWENTDYDLAYKKYQERFADASDFNFYFVGNIDDAKIEAYVETYLASLPSTYSKEKFKNVAAKPLKGILKKNIKKGKEAKSKVRVIYQGEAKYKSKDAYYLKSLGEVLSIKLIEQLREEEGGVYGVGARGSMSKYPKGSYNFTISFPCGPENVEKLTKKAFLELEKIQKNGISEKDLNKIKETQLLEYKEQQKKNSYWLALLKNADFGKYDRSKALDKVKQIEALTSKDIQKVAKKYLKKNRIIATLNPED